MTRLRPASACVAWTPRGNFAWVAIARSRKSADGCVSRRRRNGACSLGSPNEIQQRRPSPEALQRKRRRRDARVVGRSSYAAGPRRRQAAGATPYRTFHRRYRLQPPACARPALATRRTGRPTRHGSEAEREPPDHSTAFLIRPALGTVRHRAARQTATSFSACTRRPFLSTRGTQGTKTCRACRAPSNALPLSSDCRSANTLRPCTHARRGALG